MTVKKEKAEDLWIDGWINERMDGWMEGWIDERREGKRRDDGWIDK